MNSKAKLCAKLIYVKSTCRVLHKDFETSKAAPTLIWMQEQCGKVVRGIQESYGWGKDGYSWAKSVDRCMKHIRGLGDETDPMEEREVSLYEGVLYGISIVTQILDDLTHVKNKKHLIEDLCTASYQLEDLFSLPKSKELKEDTIREQAQRFVKKLYCKIDELS